MKINAVYDRDGRILAAIIDDGKYDSPRPVASEGMEAGTFDVPALVNSLSLEEICTTFRIDSNSRSLVKR